MKCKYSYCKHGGEVDKDKAFREGNNYYHEDCYKEKTLKQEIEEYYLANMKDTTLQLLRKVIKQLIHEKKYDAEFVLYTLKYITKNNKPINSPFGLLNYCTDNRIHTEWKNSIINKQYKEMKENSNTDTSEDNKVIFTYKPSTKKVTDII